MQPVSYYKLLYFFPLKGVSQCYHMSIVTPDHIWISDNKNNLNLTNATGETLHHLDDLLSGFGVHTVNGENELIYINKNRKISKLSKKMKTSTTFIKNIIYGMKPSCVYWSPFTGILLVDVYEYISKTGKVIRFNQTGELTETIQHDKYGLEMFHYPSYITENKKNGDVVVSDHSAVVVTEWGGRHRFTYTGHPSGSGIIPLGICVDMMSHIFVCDVRHCKIHILDKDGHFLSNLLTESGEIMDYSFSLSYKF